MVPKSTKYLIRRDGLCSFLHVQRICRHARQVLAPWHLFHHQETTLPREDVHFDTMQWLSCKKSIFTRCLFLCTKSDKLVSEWTQIALYKCRRACFPCWTRDDSSAVVRGWNRFGSVGAAIAFGLVPFSINHALRYECLCSSDFVDLIWWQKPLTTNRDTAFQHRCFPIWSTHLEHSWFYIMRVMRVMFLKTFFLIFFLRNMALIFAERMHRTSSCQHRAFTASKGNLKGKIHLTASRSYTIEKIQNAQP